MTYFNNRRRFGPSNSKLVPKAHAKDPGSVIARTTVRNLPVDIEQLIFRQRDIAQHLRSQYRGPAPSGAGNGSGAPSLPTQVQNTLFVQNVGINQGIVKLIPKNVRRINFGISVFLNGPTPPIFWTYGQPPLGETGRPIGRTLSIAGGGYRAEVVENGQSVSIDDIYIFSNSVSATQVIGWEGTIAPQAAYT